MNHNQRVIRSIEKIRPHILPVLHVDYQSVNIPIIDLSAQSHDLIPVDLYNMEALVEAIFEKIRESECRVGISRYNENRAIYRNFDLFQGESPRTVHLGVDLWVQPETPVFSPISGKIHSFQNNAAEGDYGPTLIIAHRIDDLTFYTLYGHLSLDSIENCQINHPVQPGQEIARVGNISVNGHWPPHLHFQIITDMQERWGDFPGVASLSERDTWLDLCPDPNLILNMNAITP